MGTTPARLAITGVDRSAAIWILRAAGDVTRDRVFGWDDLTTEDTEKNQKGNQNDPGFIQSALLCVLWGKFVSYAIDTMTTTSITCDRPVRRREHEAITDWIDRRT